MTVDNTIMEEDALNDWHIYTSWFAFEGWNVLVLIIVYICLISCIAHSNDLFIENVVIRFVSSLLHAFASNSHFEIPLLFWNNLFFFFFLESY